MNEYDLIVVGAPGGQDQPYIGVNFRLLDLRITPS